MKSNPFSITSFVRAFHSRVLLFRKGRRGFGFLLSSAARKAQHKATRRLFSLALPITPPEACFRQSADERCHGLPWKMRGPSFCRTQLNNFSDSFTRHDGERAGVFTFCGINLSAAKYIFGREKTREPWDSTGRSVVVKAAPTWAETLPRLESVEIETRPRLCMSKKINNKTETMINDL